MKIWNGFKWSDWEPNGPVAVEPDRIREGNKAYVKQPVLTALDPAKPLVCDDEMVEEVKRAHKRHMRSQFAKEVFDDGDIMEPAKEENELARKQNAELVAAVKEHQTSLSGPVDLHADTEKFIRDQVVKQYERTGPSLADLLPKTCPSTYTEPTTGEIRRCTFMEGHIGKTGMGSHEHGIVGLRTWPDDHADKQEKLRSNFMGLVKDELDKVEAQIQHVVKSQELDTSNGLSLEQLGGVRRHHEHEGQQGAGEHDQANGLGLLGESPDEKAGDEDEDGNVCGHDADRSTPTQHHECPACHVQAGEPCNVNLHYGPDGEARRMYEICEARMESWTFTGE